MKRTALHGSTLAIAMLASCSQTPRPSAPPSATTTTIAAAVPPPPAPAPASPPSRSSSIALVFTVDPARSLGTIDTILDPDGITLGPRPGQCQCPLRGTIAVRLTGHPDGPRLLEITRVSLASTTDAKLHFEWNALLGDIRCNIPAGTLRITDHTLTNNRSPIDRAHRFHLPDNRFSVQCPSTIQGEGLVLGKAVGRRQTDLDIPVTDPVLVSGSLTTAGNLLELRIPAAVLKDRFDLGEATLDLVFTGDLAATCPAP